MHAPMPKVQSRQSSRHGSAVLLPLLFGLLLAVAFAATSRAQTAATECVADLETLAPYLLANDAGALRTASR